MNMHGLSSSASLAKPNAYKYNGGTELTAEFGWEMYDTPNRSYDAQLGRFHQVDPLADSQSSFTPYHFGYNDPIYWSDPTGLCPSCYSMTDIYNELMGRSSDEGSTIFNFIDGNLVRNHAAENDWENWIEDFTNYGGTAEYVQDGGGFWMDYGNSLYQSSDGSGVQSRQSKFFKMPKPSGDGLGNTFGARVSNWSLWKKMGREFLFGRDDPNSIQATVPGWLTPGGAGVKGAQGIAKGTKWITRMLRKYPDSQVAIKQIGSYWKYSINVVGKNSGHTVYTKYLNSNGKTLKFFHDTFDKTGKFLHRGWTNGSQKIHQWWDGFVQTTGLYKPR